MEEIFQTHNILDKQLESKIIKRVKSSREFSFDDQDDQDDDIPRKILMSLVRQVLQMITIRNHNKIKQYRGKSPKTLQQIMKLSKRLHYPPLGIVNVLKLKIPNHIHKKIYKRDWVFGVDNDDILLKSQAFEIKVANHLDKYNISYKTEQDIRNETKNPTATPDFIITDGNHDYNDIAWIDAKNYYGGGLPMIQQRLNKQAKKYRCFGKGCFVFNGGFSSMLKPPPNTKLYYM